MWEQEERWAMYQGMQAADPPGESALMVAWIVPGPSALGIVALGVHAIMSNRELTSAAATGWVT
jgi:hypothetical protein